MVVVVAQEPAEENFRGIEFVETLEAPDKPDEVEIEDEDMLRENDVIEGDLIIDKSDELLHSVMQLFKFGCYGQNAYANLVEIFACFKIRVLSESCIFLFSHTS